MPPTPHKFKPITINSHDELPVPSPISPSPIYHETIEEESRLSEDISKLNEEPELNSLAPNQNTSPNNPTTEAVAVAVAVADIGNSASATKNEQNIPHSDSQNNEGVHSQPCVTTTAITTEINEPISINTAPNVEIDSEYDAYNRSESPPSLELTPQKYSDNECDMKNLLCKSKIYFLEFACVYVC